MLANGLLALVSLVLGLGLVEAAARIAMGRPGDPVAAQYTEPDPVRGWRHRPGARGSFGHGSYLINRLGLRDVERAQKPAPGVSRLLVIGDSFAEGFSVSLDESVSRVLERDLGAPACPVEVVNGGTVGYSTDQEYLFYRDEGSAFEPGVVVLFFYYNDILANARGAVDAGTPKPLFTFTGGRPRVKNYPLPPPRPSDPGPRYWRGSAVLTFVRERLREGAPRAYNALARLRFWSPIRPGDVPLELRVYDREPPEPVVQAWLQTDHLLGLLDREVRSHGARLVVAYVPTKMEVRGPDWDLTRRRYTVDDRTWDRRAVARRLEDAGSRLGFPVVDLTEVLWREDRGLRGGPYYATGGHWNALGHATAAREIARFVRDNGWLTCPAKLR